MLDKIQKYSIVALVLGIVVLGAMSYFKQRSLEKQIVELHNQIALNTETIEVYKNNFEKKTAELSNLNSLLKTFQENKGRDAETIAKLREELKKKDARLLTVSRAAVKWRKAYKAQVKANVEVDPGKDPDSKEDDRIKVSFKKDFGYLGVEGYTLTNPGFADIEVKQNRPLVLTTAISQEKDGSWTTNVVSSEDNIEADIQISAVNPRVFKKKWYEKISLDLGVDMNSSGLYPYTGLSIPVGPVSVSGGFWGDTPNEKLGYYSTINYSWNIFSRD
jgi:uncharacterized membrane-anchored protein YhcB (DUF1043 family)